ncbi:hypothetical protein DL769_006034 [Monosporascus sp. CRB-8-3]|nr:hypothetical protein DL769_006034 [Monosporascus sp. CRB-8-3]
MYALFNRTKAPAHTLCASCTLLRSDGDNVLLSSRSSSMSRPKFADADRCSCNSEGCGSGPPCCYPERKARREFWYASSDGGDAAPEEAEHEDVSADDAKEDRGKKANRGGGIFKFGGILRRGDAEKDASSGNQSLRPSDPEGEAEADADDDAPAPLSLQPNAFPGVLSVDGEAPPTTTGGRGHGRGRGTIPSILVRRVQYTPPTPRPRSFDESSVPLPSPGLLSPPFLALGARDRSPFVVVSAAEMGNRRLE